MAVVRLFLLGICWVFTFALAGAATGSTDDANYRLTGDDLIDFHVFQEPDLDSVVRIAADGSASFPLVGNVSIGGKTIPEAVELLNARYRDGYLVSPQVSLTVHEYAKKRFTVLGQVQRPGSYEIEGTDQITLLQAIGMAGGYTRIADPSSITVKRREGAGEKVIKVNAKKMARGDTDTSFIVKTGDVISVAESMF